MESINLDMSRLATLDPLSENFGETVNAILDEYDSDSACSDYGEDNVEEGSEVEDELSASENSDNPESEEENRGNVLMGKNGHRKTFDPPSKLRRTPAKNIIRLPSCKAKAPTHSEKDAWSILVNEDFMQIIVHFTNMEIRNQKKNYDNASYINDTNTDEIIALIGILYKSGTRKDSNLKAHEIWSLTLRCPFYRSVISECRFRFLINCLRFDVRETRNKDDTFSPILAPFKLQKKFVPREYCIVDEQLLGFRGQ